MKWKTTNHIGKEITWVSEDEIVNIDNQKKSLECDVKQYRYIMSRIKDYTVRLQKTNNWWAWAYRKVLISNILTLIKVVEGNYGNFESDSN